MDIVTGNPEQLFTKFTHFNADRNADGSFRRIISELMFGIYTEE